MTSNFKRMLLLSAFAVPAMTIAAQAADTSDSLETITVVGTRTGADRAQFSAPVTISVMSAQDLEHTAVHNVAEALQLLPGINVTNTGHSFFGGVDGASRGEGMFAQVRGMNSEFTLNLLNGIDVAQGMPYSREVQLSLLPPSGLQTIIVNKTGGANQELDFIGGMIDYRTPTAFDFNEDRTFSATVGGRAETRAFDYNTDGMGYSAALEASQKFGAAKQFGAYFSAYFDIRHYANSLYGAATESSSDGAWAYAVAASAPDPKDPTKTIAVNPTGYNPAKNLVSTGFNAGVSSGYTARYGGNAAFDWNISDNTHAFAKVSYAFAHTRQDSTMSQIIGMNVNKLGMPMSTTGLYQPVIGNISTRMWYETNPENANLGTAQLGGDTSFGKLSVTGRVFYTWGNNDRPNHIEISNRPLINGGNGFVYGGSSLGTLDPDGLITPLMTSDIYARLNDNGSNPARRSGQKSMQHSGQEKGGIMLDATYDVGPGWLKSIQFGFKHTSSWRHVDDSDWTNPKFSDGRLFSSLGIYSSSWSAIFPGKYDWAQPKIDQAKLFSLFEQYNSGVSDSCEDASIGSACNTQNGREAVTSVYAQADLAFGDFEVIPGLRFEHTDIHNVFWKDNYNTSNHWIGGEFSSNSTTYDEPLPSLFVNYRPDDAQLYRASVWTSYTRPAFIQLAAHTSIKPGETISVTEGNPDLKPIKAVNFDFSGQWYSSHGGYIQASAFAKLLSDYIYNSGSVFANDSGDAAMTTVSKPLNGGGGHIYGIELEFRQKLDELSGWLGGFGVGGNFTHNWTKVNLGANTGMLNEQVQNAPDNIANLQLFYEKDGFQFDVIWHYTGSYVSSYDYLGIGKTNWDHMWVQPNQRVDLHVGYEFVSGLQGDVSVSNLMNDYSYQAQVGKYSSALTDIVDTGRTILFTIKYKN